MVTQETKRVPNWKCPGPYEVQGYWLKTFLTLHERMPTQMNDMINHRTDISIRMTTRKKICQKDLANGICVG